MPPAVIVLSLRAPRHIFLHGLSRCGARFRFRETSSSADRPCARWCRRRIVDTARIDGNASEAIPPAYARLNRLQMPVRMHVLIDCLTSMLQH